MKTESITWRELPADGMPTDDATVHIECIVDAGAPSQIWQAFWDGMHWIDVSGGHQLHSSYTVVAWAPLPKGTRQC